MSEYRIREVDGFDADVAHEIEALHSLTFWKDAPDIDPEAGHWWFAYHNKAPVAFAGVVPSTWFQNLGYFHRVGVLPEHRGKGLQVRLMRTMEARARKIGWDGIVSDTTAWNAASANSFIKMGYRVFTPTFRWSYHDAIYWCKRLAGVETIPPLSS